MAAICQIRDNQYMFIQISVNVIFVSPIDNSVAFKYPVPYRCHQRPLY